jgi:hypothetical protein
MGLTPRTAEDGCIIISQQDLFDEQFAPKIAAYTVTVCQRGPGHLSIDSEMLTGLGFTPDKYHNHRLSAIALGSNTVVELFQTGDFTGTSKTIQSSSPLCTVKYADGTDANDNVNSLKFTSKTAGDVFAGKSCGITFSVCPAVVTSDIVRGEISPGCVLLSPNDPTSPQYYDTEVKVVRFCAANEAGTVTVTRDNLKALELVRTWGDFDSMISYINKGTSLKTIFYEGPDADTRISGINTGSGSLVHMYYDNGHGCNDNVYSVDVNGGDPKIPWGCKF